ncbi:hypothetical protein BXZ70DRAFT_261697 [Cristinia sonorae]|uniref:Uncharacterized protein n=1 Tax=Cristinia sonorae TaxID=1940300 RepID=A0A8K0UWZ2_9AGAR|nr:hypothetical protein BXZ70DRAFT_261697 [Cristinia sonorae]
MVTSYGPDEARQDILTERAFLAGDFISGMGYGMQVMLYISCARYLFSERKRGRNPLYILAYITLLLITQTILCIVQARTVQVMYIDNRNFPGGPWAYFLATQNQAINVMFYACLFVLTFLSDLLVLWRCWVIWTVSGRVRACLVVGFPTIMLLGSFVLGTLWTLESSQPGLSLYSKLPVAYGTSYYAVSLSINIILTILITIRLYLYRRELVSKLPAEFAKHYISLAAIIVESAAMYSVFAVIFLITYAINNPMNQIFLGFASLSQQISTYLIIYRVADGRAFSDDSLSGNALTTLQFVPGPVRHSTGDGRQQSDSEEPTSTAFTSQKNTTEEEIKRDVWLLENATSRSRSLA